MNTEFTTVLKGRLHYGGLILRKHSPAILVAAGIVGGITAAVLGAKATLKAPALVEEAKQEIAKLENPEGLQTQQDYNQKLGMVYINTGVKFAKLYAPAVGVGVVSIAAVLASHGIMKRREVGLVAAYQVLAEGFRNYRLKVIEELGEEKDQSFRASALLDGYEEEIYDEDGKSVVKRKDIPAHSSDYARIFDETSMRWRPNAETNLAFLRSQQNYMNEKLRIDKIIFLNDVYEALGLEPTRAGQIVGWKYESKTGDGFISFGISNSGNAVNPVKNYLLDFNVDGPVLNYLED